MIRVVVITCVVLVGCAGSSGPPLDRWAGTDEYIDGCQDSFDLDVPESMCRCVIDVARRHYDTPRDFQDSDGTSSADDAFAHEFLLTCQSAG